MIVRIRNKIIIKYFIDHTTRALNLYQPFITLYDKVWFSIPRYIESKTVFNRTYSTDPIIPFFKMITTRGEGECWNKKWWKNIKIVK